MEPVYCQNGHPNRPGTRICAVCRALLPPPTSSDTPARSSPPKPRIVPAPAPQPLPPLPDTQALAESTRAEAPLPLDKPAPPKRSRVWLWLLLLLGLILLGIVAVWAVFFPVTRTTGETSTTVPSTAAVALAQPTAHSNPTESVAPTEAASATPLVTAAAATISPTAVATITPLPTIVGVIITPTFAFGRDVNFIQNGGFTDDWTNGWTSESRGSRGVIEALVTDDEPGLPLVRLENSGPGMVRLAQRVVLAFPAEGMVLRGRVRLSGMADGPEEGRSALILRYEDANGEPLGASVWLDGADDSTALWSESPLPVLDGNTSVRVVDEEWQDLELWLDREFAEELPEVNPVDVRQITVILAVLGSDDCDTTGCLTALEATSLSLTAEAP